MNKRSSLNVSDLQPYKFSIWSKTDRSLYVFTLTLQNPSNYSTSIQIAKLSVKSFWKRICGKEKYIKSKNISYVYFPPTLKCTKYSIDTNLHDYDFDAQGKYRLYVHLFTMPKMMLEINPKYLNENQYVHVKYSINTVHIAHSSKYQVKYKLFYNLKNISWALAYSKCLQKNMTLPIFSSWKHLTEVMSTISRKYSFQPIAIFVGIIQVSKRFIYKVHLVILFTK